MDKVLSALAEYGATLGKNNHITKNGRTFGIRAVVKGYRLRFEDATTGALRMAGPVDGATVASFVEKYWMWQKCK